MLLLLAPALVLWFLRCPETQLGYVRLIGSLFGFLRDNATLRRASTIQFLLGISYGGFWATVAPMMLALARFRAGADRLLAIPGAAGILVSQPAGRWTDRYGGFPVVTAGVGLVSPPCRARIRPALGRRRDRGRGVARLGAALGDRRETRRSSRRWRPRRAAASTRFFGAHIWGRGTRWGRFFASTRAPRTPVARGMRHCGERFMRRPARCSGASRPAEYHEGKFPHLR